MAELDRKVQATLDFLVARYPVFADGKPLAVGTREQLLERHPELELRLLKSALVKHCNRPRYLKTLAAESRRYALDGEPQGLVTPEERERAIGKLDAQREKEQLALQRRVDHEQREAEAVQRRAERAAKELRIRNAKAARKGTRSGGYRKDSESRSVRPSVPLPAGGDPGKRRPVVVVRKQRPRDGDPEGDANS